MKCFKCNIDSPLFRTNAYGVIAQWACREHCTKPIDPEVQDIVDTIEALNSSEARGEIPKL